MAKNTIKVKKYSDIIEEYGAAAAITPGMLVELASATTVRAHASAAQNALPMFALEDELQGNGIDDAFASGDRVQVWIPGRGDIVYALLADGENAAVGNFLVSNGAGRLQVFVAEAFGESSGDTGTIYPNQIVGQALEAVDMSGSAGADPSGRILIRII